MKTLLVVLIAAFLLIGCGTHVDQINSNSYIRLGRADENTIETIKKNMRYFRDGDRCFGIICAQGYASWIPIVIPVNCDDSIK